MLRDECEAEPRADAVARRRAACESFEDALPFTLGDARTAVFDGEAEPSRRCCGQFDPEGPSTVIPGVLEQVAENTLESHLVERDLVRCAADCHDGYVGFTEPGRHPLRQIDERDIFDVQIRCPGIEPREFQQVDHHAVEPAHLVDDDVEGLLSPLREFVTPPVEDLDRGGEGRDRRPQLVADVGREASLPLDAGLDGVGHVVERSGESVEVRVGFRGEARVESARCDVGSGVGHLAQWPEQTPAGGQPEQGGEYHRAERSEQQRREDRCQSRRGLGERERLEIAGVVLGDVHAHGDVVGSVDRGVLERARAAADAVDESFGEVGDRVEHARTRSRGGRVA